VIAQALITATVRHGVVRPHWLTARDLPWLEALLEARRASAGGPRGDWDRLLKRPVHATAEPRRQALAAVVLERHAPRERPTWPVHPREIRAELFRRAALGDTSRTDCVEAAARHLGLQPDTIEGLLFQDFKAQRALVALPVDLGSEALALACNLALAQGLVARARDVELTLRGAAHRVVRAARLRGLICEVRQDGTPDGAVLRISGPLSLFHHTRLYGRALASLLPTLRWCDDHRLTARCAWKGGEGLLHLDPTAPLPASPPTRRYDSTLEERFARDFTRAAPDWELTRDPAPLRAGAGLVFPDFGLRHRTGLHASALLELVGFWTPAYLRRKLERYRSATTAGVILAIDATREVSEAALPRDARILRFRKRVDPATVLGLLEA